MTRQTESPLKTLRRSRTLSQTDLANLIGVTQETVSKAERGLIRLQPALQARIAAVLGASVKDIFHGEEERAVAS